MGLYFIFIMVYNCWSEPSDEHVEECNTNVEDSFRVIVVRSKQGFDNLGTGIEIAHCDAQSDVLLVTMSQMSRGEGDRGGRQEKRVPKADVHSIPFGVV